jgi:acetyltransferase-like isoleucine patch superfamily enzyme
MMKSRYGRILDSAVLQLWGLVGWIVNSFPNPLGSRLRYLYWKRRLHSLGKNVRFGMGVHIYSPEWVRIGDDCWIDDYVIILAGPVADDGQHICRRPNPNFSFKEGEVVIGQRVHVAPFVQLQGHGGLHIGSRLTIAAGAKVYSLSHHHRDLTGRNPDPVAWKFVGLVPGEEQALICAPTVIGDNAAVGLNSVVLPGSVIGHNSWLGAQSLLQGELAPDVIAAGVPARVLKNRLGAGADPRDQRTADSDAHEVSGLIG